MTAIYRFLAPGEQLEPGDEELVQPLGRSLEWVEVDTSYDRAVIVRRKVAEVPDRTEGRTATVTLPLQWVQERRSDSFRLTVCGTGIAGYVHTDQVWSWYLNAPRTRYGDAATEDDARAAILAALMDAAVTG